jgi:hypothetical protein
MHLYLSLIPGQHAKNAQLLAPLPSAGALSPATRALSSIYAMLIYLFTAGLIIIIWLFQCLLVLFFLFLLISLTGEIRALINIKLCIICISTLNLFTLWIENC